MMWVLALTVVGGDAFSPAAGWRMAGARLDHFRVRHGWVNVPGGAVRHQSATAIANGRPTSITFSISFDDLRRVSLTMGDLRGLATVAVFASGAWIGIASGRPQLMEWMTNGAIVGLVWF